MSRIIIYLVIVSSFVMVSIDAQIYANGTVLRDLPNMCTRAGPQCSEDCVHLMLCAAGEAEPLETVPCATSTPSTPYCNGNTCSKYPGDCTKAESFRCTGEGVYPDPKNCSQYRECAKSNAESQLLGCPKGFIFNSKINRCEMGRLSSLSKICNTVDCSRKVNEVVVYRSNPAYFAFCFVDATNKRRETIMFKCEYEHEIYDPSTNMCKFNCESAGHFQDPTDCSYYYVCSAAAFGTYGHERVQCPTDYYFDGEKCTTESSKCSPNSVIS